jgi:predicted Zn-dependent peptidase
MYQKRLLDNGLRVITSSMAHCRSVCIAILVGAGSCYETEEEAGVSHFAEHLFFKGTERRRTSKEISEAIEGVGGILNGGTDKEITIFWCKVASAHFSLALDVLSDLLLYSRFDTRDIEQERQVIMEEINMNLDIPQQRVTMLIDELLWPKQPLGRDALGYKETVSSLTREQILSYVARRYLPNNTVISVAGNIEEEKVLEQIGSLFSRWAPGEITSDYLTNDDQTEPRIRVETRDIEQAHLCLAFHGFSHYHPKRFALDLLNTALGGGMSSRLFTEIREQRGLAYDIHSFTDHFLNSGSLTIYAGVDPRKMETAIATILEEISKIKREITPEEVTRAKELTKGRLHLRLEDSRNVALWYGVQEILIRRILDIDEVVSIIDAVQLDELREIAQQVLVARAANLALVGSVRNEQKLLDLLNTDI